MMMRRLATLTIGMILVAAAAHAHPGHDHAQGLAHGFAHPLFGLDHLLAMVAVGLWAAQCGGRAVWAVPAAFVGSMAAGGVLGMAGVPLVAVEAMILLSVLLLGLMVARAWKMPTVAGLALVALFAIMHGHAHGAELASGGGAIGYAAGFLVATAMLHAAGVACAVALRRNSASHWIQYGGGAIAACGLAMMVGLI